MAVFTRDASLADASNSPSSGWLTTLGIILLIGTIFHDLVGISFENPAELARRGAEILSIYLMI